MATPTKVELGAFAAGEVPPDLVVSYTDFDGNVVNLTGFSVVEMNIEEELGSNTQPLGTGTVNISDPPNGEVTYQWHRNDMLDTGEYQAQVWVSDGNKYYASDLYIYSVYDGPEEPPT